MMAQTGYGCVTALYDCRSKQEYIYRTNRIREISGGSELLANVYGMLFRAAEKKGLRIFFYSCGFIALCFFYQ